MWILTFDFIITGDKVMRDIRKKNNLIITYKNNSESRSELIKFLIDFLVNEKVNKGDSDVYDRKKE
jgi:hypothetical protein